MSRKEEVKRGEVMNIGNFMEGRGFVMGEFGCGLMKVGIRKRWVVERV